MTDPDTGIVSRIDPAQLTTSAVSNSYGQGIMTIADAHTLYVVSTRDGRVDTLDPYTLAPSAPPITLKTAVSGAGFAADGTAWLALPDEGRLVPVKASKAGAAVPVAPPGDHLGLTIAGGAPVAVDSSTDALTAIRRDGGTHVEPALRVAPEERPRLLQVAPSMVGTVVPVVPSGTSTLLLVDLNRRTTATVDLRSQRPSAQLGAPVANGGRVYVPDPGRRQVIVYDATQRRFAAPVPIGGSAHGLTVFVRDGSVWINTDASQAAVVNQNGTVRSITKDSPGIPEAPKRSTPQHAITIRPVTNGPASGVAVPPVVAGTDHRPSSHPTPPHHPTPVVPAPVRPPSAPPVTPLPSTPTPTTPSPSISPSPFSSTPITPPPSTPPPPQAVTHYSCAYADGDVPKLLTPNKYWENNFAAQGTTITGGWIDVGAGSPQAATVGIYGGDAHTDPIGTASITVNGWGGVDFTFSAPLHVTKGQQLFLTVIAGGTLYAYDEPGTNGCFVGHVDGFA